MNNTSNDLTMSTFTTQENTLRFKQFIPGIAWFLFVLILICIPGQSLPETNWLNLISFDKLVHGLLFGGIVFLFCRPFSKTTISIPVRLKWFVLITFITCFWGLGTELIQRYFVPGRQFDMVDWAADSLGSIAAFFVVQRFFLKSQPKTPSI